MTFPREEITELEMGFRCRAIAQVVLRGPAQASLGRLKSGGHKVWEWQVRRAKANSIINARTASLYTNTFGVVDTSTSGLVDVDR